MNAFCSPVPLNSALPRSSATYLSARRPALIRACASREAALRDDDEKRVEEDGRARVRISYGDDAAAKAAAQSVWDAAAGEASLFKKDEEEDDGWCADDCVAVAWSDGRPVGAGRLTSTRGNARLDCVYVLPSQRGHGTGRAIVHGLLGAARQVEGAVYVKAHPVEFGFYSLLGFEAQGPEEEGGRRAMVMRVPECAPGEGCVGLHHTSLRVRDIERSLAFYGGVGFFVTDKFLTAGGARACFVEGLGTRLELVEVGEEGRGGLASTFGAGFDRLVFDVTKACTDLDTYIAHLRRRNGGVLNVRGPTATQVVGKYVVSVATVEDVDGLPIEFIRREASVPSSLRTRVKW